MHITLSEWARRYGVSASTAHRWYQEDALPQGVTARQDHPRGVIQVHVDPLAGVDLDELAQRLAPRLVRLLDPHELAGVLRSAGYTVAGPECGAGEQSPHCAEGA